MTDAAPDLSKKRELHDDAKSLLEDKAFQHAISQCRMRWYEQMMTALDREQRDELMAMSKALRGIQDELVVIINDYKKAVHDAARRQPHHA
jgi:L-alanine-DL-glutamate epimerase-like enolase superfamily enzyme